MVYEYVLCDPVAEFCIATETIEKGQVSSLLDKTSSRLISQHIYYKNSVTLFIKCSFAPSSRITFVYFTLMTQISVLFMLKIFPIGPIHIYLFAPTDCFRISRSDRNFLIMLKIQMRLIKFTLYAKCGTRY